MKRTTAPGSTAGGLFKESAPATRVTAEDLNNHQEEICNVIEAAGLALDGDDPTQLLQAIQVLVAQALARVQVDTFASGAGPFALTFEPSGGLLLRFFDGRLQPAANLPIAGTSASLGVGVDNTLFDTITVVYAY